MEINTIEKFLIIMHNVENSKFYVDSYQLKLCLVVISLSELVKEKRIIIKDQRVIVQNFTATEGMLNELFSVIKESPKSKPIDYWLKKLLNKADNLKWQVINKLVSKNIFEIKDKKRFGLFTYREIVLVDRNLRQKIIDDLKIAVLKDEKLTAEQVLLLGLLRVLHQIPLLTAEQNELAEIKNKLRTIVKQNEIVLAVSKIVKGMEERAGCC